MAYRTTAKSTVAAKTPTKKKAAERTSGSPRKVTTSDATSKSPTTRRAATRQETVARGQAAVRRASSTLKSSPTRSVTRVAASVGYLPERRSEFLIRVLGNQRVADLVKVNKSQPSRWKTGQEAPGPAAARRLVDLDHVLARLVLVWEESLAADWLTTPNGFLEGATPMQVIESRGTTDVIEAIDAETAGAYA